MRSDSETTFTDCTTVDVNGSQAFPRRYMVVFDGVFHGTGNPANGECRLELDNSQINGTKTNVHSAGPNAGFGINIVTTRRAASTRSRSPATRPQAT